MNERNHSMRQGSSGPRRSRGGRHSGGEGRGNGGEGRSSGGGMRDRAPRSAASLRHQTFDSNGPDVRVRGNAWQVYEKYQSLARDAASSGDRVMAENYLQHAEHYFRVTEAIEEATAAEARQRTAVYGAQPETPPAFFVPEGKGMAGHPSSSAPAPSAAAAAPSPAAGGEAPMGQAEVIRRTPAPPPSAFFAADDAEETGSNPQTLVAGR